MSISMWLPLLVINGVRPPLASAFIPIQTTYSNVSLHPIPSTTSFVPIPTPASLAATDCVPNCTYQWVDDRCAYWWTYTPSYITVATLLIIINAAKNTTTTSTSYVESLLVNGLPPTNDVTTNSAGTAVAVGTGYDGLGTTVTYPTPYCDYQYNFSWAGVVPSTSSGHSTCVTAVTQTTDSLGPSHPNLPFITDVGGIYASSLPVGAGLQYALALTVGGLLPARIVASAFSDQLAGGVYSLCDQYSAALPILYGTVASYLTDTLTKYESGGTLGTVSAPDKSSGDGIILPTSPSQAETSTQPVTTALSSASLMFDISSIFSTTAWSPKILSSSTFPSPLPYSASQLLPVTSEANHLLQTTAATPSEGSKTSSPVTSLGYPVASTVSSATSATLPASLFLTNFPLVFGETVTTNSQSHYILGSQTLVPNAPTITVELRSSDATVALQTTSGRTQLVVDGITYTIASPSTAVTPALPILTLVGTTYTANKASAYEIAGQTLQQGGSAITISGTPVSLAAGASILIVGTSKFDIALNPTTVPVFTADGSTNMKDSGSAYATDSQGLVSGGVMGTASSGTMSIASPATSWEVGGNSWSPMSGTGAPRSTGMTVGMPFTGGIEGKYDKISVWMIFFGNIVVVVGLTYLY